MSNPLQDLCVLPNACSTIKEVTRKIDTALIYTRANRYHVCLMSSHLKSSAHFHSHGLLSPFSTLPGCWQDLCLFCYKKMALVTFFSGHGEKVTHLKDAHVLNFRTRDVTLLTYRYLKGNRDCRWNWSCLLGNLDLTWQGPKSGNKEALRGSERYSQRVTPPTAAASEMGRSHIQGCNLYKPGKGKTDSPPPTRGSRRNHSH